MNETYQNDKKCIAAASFKMLWSKNFKAVASGDSLPLSKALPCSEIFPKLLGILKKNLYTKTKIVK